MRQTDRHIQTYIHTGTYIQTYIHTDIQTYIHTYRHTYIQTYIHTDIHTYRHIGIQTRRHTHIQGTEARSQTNIQRKTNVDEQTDRQNKHATPSALCLVLSNFQNFCGCVCPEPVLAKSWPLMQTLGKERTYVIGVFSSSCESRHFCAIFAPIYRLKRSFCQDRFGTNMGKPLPKIPFFALAG